MAKWEEMMWAELEAQPETERIITCGEWISHITQKLLPALGKYRRDKVVDLLDQPDMDYSKLADTIGARRQTIIRLAEEGRAGRRRAT